MARHHNQIRRRGIITREEHWPWNVAFRHMRYVACVLLLVGSGIARADGGKSLVVGSVYRMGKNYIEVEVHAKEIVAVKTDASTTYFDSGVNKPARSQDLAVGDQVAITVVAKNGVNVAEQIKFVPSQGARKTKPAPKTQ
jgi:hypothetical protein